jgi:Fibronectin type III domain.
VAQQYYPPFDFQGIPISSSEINLSWVNLTEYKRIEIRRDDTESVFLYGSAESYIWSGLSANTEYAFRIQAQYPNGVWSGYSDPIYISTYGQTSPPQDLEIEVRGATVELNWISISLDADEIQIFRSDADHVYGETPLATVWPNVEYYCDESPLPHCWYKLRTKRGINYSDWSSEVECQNYGAPDPVVNLAVSKIRPTWAVLNWGVSPTSAPVENFKIEEWTGTEWVFFCDVPWPFKTKKIIGLTPDTQYKYRIRSENLTGTSPYAEISFITEERDTLFFESKTKEKEIVYVATIFTEPEIIVSSGEYPEAFANLYIETDEINYSAVSRLLSQGLETTAGQIVISATKGITEDDLKSTFFDAGLISKEILIEVYFPETATSYPIVKGLISKIEYREHKIYLSYDDIFSSKNST